MRRVLDLPAYRRLLTAYGLNEIALSISALTVSLLVLRRTGSSVAAAGYFVAAQFVPAFLAPSLVGRLAGYPTRRVLPALYGGEAVLFGLLAWLAHRFTLPGVLGVALLDGVLALAARALARTATVTVTAPAGLLREGNAVANTVFSLCFMAGPGLAGLIVAAGGAVPALLVNAAVFALIALLLSIARSLPVPEGAVDDRRGRVRAALEHVRGRAGLRELFLLQGAAVFFFAVTVPVEVVLATRTLHAGAAGFGALGSLWGVGAVGGSAVFARLRAASARALICGGAGALAAGIGLMAAAPDLAVAGLGAALAGAGNGVEGVAARSAMQELTEPGWMALTMSLADSLQQALPGAGFLLGGALTALSGPRLALAVAAIGAALVTAGAWPLLRVASTAQAVA